MLKCLFKTILAIAGILILIPLLILLGIAVFALIAGTGFFVAIDPYAVLTTVFVIILILLLIYIFKG